MKILHIAPAYCENGGGIHEVVENLSHEQANNNSIVHVDIVSIENIRKKTLNSRNIYDILPSKIYQINKIIRSLNFFAINLQNYDVIHIHGAWSFQLILYLPFLNKYKEKSVYQPHGLIDPVRTKKNYFVKMIAWRIYQQYYLKLAKKIIACSAKEEIEIKLLTKKKINIRTIPNGIDNQFFEKKLIKQIINSKKLLFFSQIIPVKNIESIIKAISILNKESNLVIYLDIYGYGETQYIKNLINLSKYLDVMTYINFRGPVERENRIKIYDEYDYFILPSYSENFGIVVLEALSRGCIVFTSNSTPWVYHYHENLRITGHDPNSIAESLKNEYAGKNIILNKEEFIKINIINYKWKSLEVSFNNFYKEN
jgi:glycosyltransferase involved in cell wall biosynthesis